LESPLAILFDDVGDIVGSKTLDRVLTSETVNGRILGKTKRIGEVPWNTVIAATGNNMSFKSDMGRRILICSLESADEHPEERSDFKRKDLTAYVQQNRAELVVSALTILRSFVCANKPYSGRTVGSYGAFCKLICGAITFAGLPNPLETIQEVRKRDTGNDTLSMLVKGLELAAGNEGLTSREILNILNDEALATPDGKENLGRELLREAFGELMDKPTTGKIGNKLKGFANRICGGKTIVAKPYRSHLKKWLVTSTSTPVDVKMLDAEADLLDGCSDHYGICEVCLKPLTGSPTEDGFINRRCASCDKDYPCVPMTTPKVESNPPESQGKFI
jgi:hypothetical protein